MNRSGTRLGRLGLAGLVSILWQALPVWSQSPQVQAGPPSEWVRKDYPARSGTEAPGEDTADVVAMLVDAQVNLETAERFSHTRQWVRTVAGVQELGTVRVTFDPSYQRLLFHDVSILRDGVSLPRLYPARVKLLQRETRLEEGAYSGVLTAALVVDDLRPGDVLICAYTITGFNPVWAGRDSDEFLLQYAVPVRELRHRLVAASTRDLHVENIGHSRVPSVAQVDGRDDAIWSASSLPAVTVPPGLPSWVWMFPVTRVLQFASWREVNAWALGLFVSPSETPPPVEAKMKELTAGRPVVEAQIEAALRFVQDDIRYFAVSLGEGSHRPRDPATVLATRYGDCKDKAVLLVALLKAAGITAHPVLVSTALREHVAERAPSPTSFDHCVVVVDDGARRHWVDPTVSSQRGTLATLPPLMYGRGLVVREGTDALTDIPFDPGRWGGTETRETYRIAPDYTSATLEVIRCFTGAHADAMRVAVADRGSFDAQLRETYTAQFPSARTNAPSVVRDDPLANRLEYVQHFIIPSLTVSNPVTGVTSIEFAPSVLLSRLPPIPPTERTEPVGLIWPHNYHLRTVVELPDTMTYPFQTEGVTNTVFDYRKTMVATGTTLATEHWFRMKVDALLPGSFDEVRHDLTAVKEKASTLLRPDIILQGRSAGQGPFKKGSAGGLAALMCIAAIGFMLLLAAAVYFWDPPRREAMLPWDPKLDGLGGWMLLLGFNVMVAPILRARLSYTAWGELDALVSAVMSNRHVGALELSATVFDVVSSSFMLAFTGLTLVLLFHRRTSFPWVACGMFVCSVVSNGAALQFILTSADATAIQSAQKIFFQSLVGAGLWVSYLMKSQRVRITFRRRRGDAIPVVPPALPGSVS